MVYLALFKSTLLMKEQNYYLLRNNKSSYSSPLLLIHKTTVTKEKKKVHIKTFTWRLDGGSREQQPKRQERIRAKEQTVVAEGPSLKDQTTEQRQLSTVQWLNQCHTHILLPFSSSWMFLFNFL